MRVMHKKREEHRHGHSACEEDPVLLFQLDVVGERTLDPDPNDEVAIHQEHVDMHPHSARVDWNASSEAP